MSLAGRDRLRNGYVVVLVSMKVGDLMEDIHGQQARGDRDCEHDEKR